MKILAAHGYEIGEYGIPGSVMLGELSKAVCKKIISIQDFYSHIILLGGWHLKEVGPYPTIGEAMCAYLVEHGVPLKKLITQFSGFSDGGCGHYMPPRDSMEEIDLLPTILKKLGFSPQFTFFDAICIRYFEPRLRFLYRNRNAYYERIITVSPPSFHLRRVIEQIPAYLITRLDPEGKGKIIQKNRDERTFTTARCTEKNLPSAWDPPAWN